MRKISEYTVSMLPQRDRYLEYDNICFVDNLDEATSQELDYAFEDHPVKVVFATLLMCVRGTARLRLNLREYEIQRNDLLVVLPNTIIDKAYFSADYKGATIYVMDNDLHHPSFGNIAFQFQNELSSAPWLIHCPQQEFDDLLAIYSLCRSVIGNDHLAYRSEILSDYKHVMASYVLSLMQHRPQPRQTLSRQQQLLRVFQDLVRRHYTEHRDVTYYADKMCITPKYLSIVVGQASGRRPLDWIRDLVILDAKAMLLSGDYTVSQISQHLHFANPSFFGKYFKEAVGCSPGQYAAG